MTSQRTNTRVVVTTPSSTTPPISHHHHHPIGSSNNSGHNGNNDGTRLTTQSTSTMSNGATAASAATILLAASNLSVTSLSASSSYSHHHPPLINGIKSSADLDRALSAYEESSIADFAPTRWTVQWPRSSNDAKRNTGDHTNKWASPRDMEAQSRAAQGGNGIADFPHRLSSHSITFPYAYTHDLRRPATGGPGMYGAPIATSSISLARPISSNLSHGHHSDHRHSHDHNDHDNGNGITATNISASLTTTATPAATSSSSRATPTRTPRLTSVRPATALPLEPFVVGREPSPGSYSPRIPTPHLQCVKFGQAPAHESLSFFGRSLVGDGNGPGAYRARVPVSEANLLRSKFSQSTRFHGHHDDKTPGPGDYRIVESATMPSVQSYMFRATTPIAILHGIGNMADKVVTGGRSTAVGPGSYDIHMNGVIARPPPHKFSSTPRFDKDKKPHILVLSDARRRASNELSNSSVSSNRSVMSRTSRQYTAVARERQMQRAKDKRDQRANDARTERARLTNEHLDKVDRIVHRKEYRQEQRRAEEDRLREEQFKRGWFNLIAAITRTNQIMSAVKRQRTDNHLAILALRTANRINNNLKKSLDRARVRVMYRAAYTIYRALRRNVIRSRMKRKDRSISIICSAWRDWAEKQRILTAFRTYRHKAVLIQQCWRGFSSARRNALLLLELQWQREEQSLANRYKDEEGKKVFHAKRQAGLLPRGVDAREARQRMIDQVHFPYVPESIAHDLLYMNYQQRRSAYLLQRADYRQKKDYVDKLTELADDLLTRAAVPIDRHHHITTIQQVLSLPLDVSSSATADVLSLMKSAPVVPKKPFFHVLLKKARLYALMYMAYSRTSVAAAVRVRIRNMMNSIVKRLNKAREEVKTKSLHDNNDINQRIDALQPQSSHIAASVISSISLSGVTAVATAAAIKNEQKDAHAPISTGNGNAIGNGHTIGHGSGHITGHNGSSSSGGGGGASISMTNNPSALNSNNMSGHHRRRSSSSSVNNMNTINRTNQTGRSSPLISLSSSVISSSSMSSSLSSISQLPSLSSPLSYVGAEFDYYSSIPEAEHEHDNDNILLSSTITSGASLSSHGTYGTYNGNNGHSKHSASVNNRVNHITGGLPSLPSRASLASLSISLTNTGIIGNTVNGNIGNTIGNIGGTIG